MPKRLLVATAAVGMDEGTSRCAILSNGTVQEPLDSVMRRQQALARCCRVMSRWAKNWKKTKANTCASRDHVQPKPRDGTYSRATRRRRPLARPTGPVGTCGPRSGTAKGRSTMGWRGSAGNSTTNWRGLPGTWCRYRRRRPAGPARPVGTCTRRGVGTGTHRSDCPGAFRSVAQKESSAFVPASHVACRRNR